MWIDLTVVLGVLTLALLSPGPDFLLVVKNSIGGERRKAMGTVLGIGAGLSVQMVVIASGFAVLPPRGLAAVQVGGALFLIWIGLRAALARAPDDAVAEETEIPRLSGQARSGFIQGFGCNLLNPKAFLFFVSLLAQVLPKHPGTAWRVVVPVAIVVHGLVCWTLISLALQSRVVARRLGRAQRWLPRLFGWVLAGVAVAVLYEAASEIGGF